MSPWTAGKLVKPGGAYFSGIAATNVWKFATKVAGPLDTNNPVVAADGSGDFGNRAGGR